MMPLPDSGREAPFTHEKSRDLQGSYGQIHTYCSEKDMYHFDQMSLGCAGATE